MKKIIFAIVLMVVFAAVSPVFAQQISEKNQSEYYYVNVPIEKIYIYKAGYIIQYRKGVNRTGNLYIPNEWFVHPGGKGELVNIPRGNEWPTLTIYYKEGEFSHMRLYVHPWRSHYTWGLVPPYVNLDDKFSNVDTLKIDF